MISEFFNIYYLLLPLEWIDCNRHRISTGNQLIDSTPYQSSKKVMSNRYLNIQMKNIIGPLYS